MDPEAKREMLHEMAVQGANSTHPLVILAIWLAGFKLQEWILVLSGVVMILQICALIRREIRATRRDKAREKAGHPPATTDSPGTL